MTGIRDTAAVLEMIGHEVHTAYDGEEAVVAAEKFKPEVVLECRRSQCDKSVWPRTGPGVLGKS
jgi:hypothetical protein